MRVGWILDGDLDQLSGGYLYDRIVVDHLRRSGDRVETLSLPTGSYARRLAGGLRRDLVRRLAAEAFDVLVQDELSHPALVGINRRLARVRPGLRRVGLVFHLRSSEPRARAANLVYRIVERAYLTTPEAFVFGSAATRRAVLAVLNASARAAILSGARPSIVAVPGADRLPSSISAEAIRRRAFEPGPLRILFAGNLIPRKGLPTLVRAVASLPPGTARLTIAGSPAFDPPYARRALASIGASGLDSVVRYLGPLVGSELSPVMANHHVLAVPSSYEGYGMAYLEGMGYGLPAIAAEAGGAGEFVRHGENGFLMRFGDAAALAEVLARLHNDRAWLADLARSALETHRAHPTWAQTGDAVRRFLAGLVAV